MKKFNNIKFSLYFFIMLLPISCNYWQYKGWNGFSKSKTELKITFNTEFYKSLNCSNEGYEWTINNLKKFSNIQFLGKEQITNYESCQLNFKFKAITKGKDSIILQYRKKNDIITQNTIIIDVE